MPKTEIPGTQVRDQSITEDDLILSDVTTLNADINKHGFLPKLPNDASKYLNGVGQFTTPLISVPMYGGYYKAGTNLYETWYSTLGVGNIQNITVYAYANQLIAVPFVITKNITLDKIAMVIRQTSANNFYYGIYNDDGNVFPNQLLVTSDLKSASTLGAKITDVNITLEAGLYWSAVITNGTIGFGGLDSLSILSWLGFGNYIEGTTMKNPITGVRANMTFDSLPNTFPQSGISTSQSAPFLLFRVASVGA